MRGALSSGWKEELRRRGGLPAWELAVSSRKALLLIEPHRWLVLPALEVLINGATAYSLGSGFFPSA